MYRMYIINRVHGPEPRSPRGNTSSNPQVSALIPRPAFDGMEMMYHRHGSNQNSHPLILVWKPLCIQFIHYHVGCRGVIGINHFKLRNFAVVAIECFLPLRWRHNGGDSVSNHQPRECLLNRSIRCRSKKTSKLCVAGLCVGNSPGTGEFPAQMASNAETVSIWWRHHATVDRGSIMTSIHRWCVMLCGSLQAKFTETKYSSHIHRYGTSGKIVVNISKSINNNNQIFWRLSKI